jgi:uncharacterized protein YerC
MYHTNIGHMNAKNNTIKVLTQKYRKLPKGIIQKVSKKTGYSEHTISMVKRGIRNNHIILEAILDELEKHNAKRTELMRRINELKNL